MKTKLFSILATVLILISSIIPITYAQEYITPPDTDGEILYQIYGSNYGGQPSAVYDIYGYTSTSTVYPTIKNGFATFFFGIISEKSPGTYKFYMFSTQETAGEMREAYLQLDVYGNNTSDTNTYTLKYITYSEITNLSTQIFLIPQMSVLNDLCLYSNGGGNVYCYYFNRRTEEEVTYTGYSGTECSSVFIGDIYPYGYSPINTESIRDAYDRGKSEGEEVGYSKGYEDALPTEADIQAIYDRGYNDGNLTGYNKGLEEGAKLDNLEVYNAGISAGQEQAELIPRAVDGFFKSIIGFFEPFLSIGFGSLNLYNLLGIMVVVTLVIVIVKVTRG